MELPDDALAVLKIYANATEPMALFDAFLVINPHTNTGDGRSRASRLYRERLAELYEATVEFYNPEQLLLRTVTPADGCNPDTYEITDAGRAVLAAAEGRSDA